jgi:hypothetical protein
MTINGSHEAAGWAAGSEAEAAVEIGLVVISQILKEPANQHLNAVVESRPVTNSSAPARAATARKYCHTYDAEEINILVLQACNALVNLRLQ